MPAAYCGCQCEMVRVRVIKSERELLGFSKSSQRDMSQSQCRRFVVACNCVG